MDFSLLDEREKRAYHEALLSVLTEVDHEFIPALSEREPMILPWMELENGSQTEGSVRAYLEEMYVTEKILGIFQNGIIVGILSFMENEGFEILTEADMPNIYICTVAVSPSARGMGITKKAYRYLLEELFPDRNFFTRTWSTNVAHTKILSAMGFREFKRIPDDRGRGIDTVYYENRRF